MVTRENKRAELFTALELALSEILNVQKMNTWISVKERSISGILNDAGVTNKNYLPVITSELKRLGLIEKDGERSGMRYRVISNIIPDIKNLAQEIYENMKEKTNQYKGYPSSEKKDLVPSAKKENKSFNESSAPLVVKRQITMPSLGDMRFIIIDNQIVEVKIIAMYYDHHNQSKIIYDVEYIDDNNEDDRWSVKKFTDVRELFDTPQLAADYLVKKYVKYIKR